MHLPRWLMLIPFLTSLGCGSHYGTIPTSHIVMVNTEGAPVDPTGNTNGKHSSLYEYRELSSDDYTTYLTNIQNSITAYATKQGVGKPHKLLIYIHGGLNFQTDTVQRATRLHERIINDAGTYPLFINWQSSLYPSYWNHLMHIRQGEDWRQGMGSTAGGYLTSPIYLASDFARAIVRAPVVNFFQVRNDIETVPLFRPVLSLWSSDLSLAQEAAFEALCRKTQWGGESKNEYKALLNKQRADCNKPRNDEKHEETHALDSFNIWTGIDQRSEWQKNTAFAKYLITFPFKMVTAPIIDALGTSSWDIMLRSVSQLFHYDNEQAKHTSVRNNHSDPYDYKTSGALTLFFKTLKETICTRPIERDRCTNDNKWEITLVGHSTGAIIIHHIIREFGELPIKNIVYMGAASSIRDYQDTVFPYLTDTNKSLPTPHSEITPPNEDNLPKRVYHLMLHEAAESGEWLNNTIDPTPRGSLLVWLDNFLSHPLSKEDRTLGRFTNFISAAHHTPNALRPYIFVSKFGVGAKLRVPQKHGDFSHLSFWKPECWEPGISPETYSDRCYAD